MATAYGHITLTAVYDGDPGADGTDGTDGTDGLGIATQDTFYAVSDSATVAPVSGWQATMPEWTNSQHLWLKIATTFTDYSIVESAPICVSLPADSKAAVIPVTCNTPAADYRKTATVAVMPRVNDLILITYTYGNTSSGPNLSLNSETPKQIRLGALAVQGGSEDQAGYVAAGGRALMICTSDSYQLAGSGVRQDTTAPTNVQTSMFLPVTNPTVDTSGNIRYGIIGVTEDSKLEKVCVSNVITTGPRVFTTTPISFIKNFVTTTSTTGNWTAGSVCAAPMYVSFRGSWSTHWRYCIGEYYNTSGILTGNATCPPVGTPIYVGGVEYADEVESPAGYFRPVEFATTLRDTALVYKWIGVVYTSGSVALLPEQTVYAYRDTKWLIYGEAKNHDTNVSLLANELLAGQAASQVALAFQMINNQQVYALDLHNAALALIDEAEEKARVAANEADDAVRAAMAKALLDYDKTADRESVVWKDENGNIHMSDKNAEARPFEMVLSPSSLDFLFDGAVSSTYAVDRSEAPSFHARNSLSVGRPASSGANAGWFEWKYEDDGSMSLSHRGVV